MIMYTSVMYHNVMGQVASAAVAEVTPYHISYVANFNRPIYFCSESSITLVAANEDLVDLLNLMVYFLIGRH